MDSNTHGQQAAVEDFRVLQTPRWDIPEGLFYQQNLDFKNAYVVMFNRLLDAAGYQPQHPKPYLGFKW